MKKIDRKKEMEKAKGFINEFKTFIKRGNVVDLAVGFIMGSAFGKIVTSMVEDILMPLIGIIIGGIDFQNLTFKIGNAVVKYGSFLQNIINFLIVQMCDIKGHYNVQRPLIRIINSPYFQVPFSIVQILFARLCFRRKP